MRSTRRLGAVLLVLGAGILTRVTLGPLLLDVIRYRTSPTTLNQVVGGDVAALVLVAPVCLAVGVLALRRHPAAPVLALAPAVFELYTSSQLVLGNEYLDRPGNVERFFPLLLALFVLAGAATVLAWGAVDAAALPARSTRFDRVTGTVLLVAATVLVVGLHLPGYIDAVRDHPTLPSYLSSPTAFWVVKLWDLGLVVPAAVTVGVGTLRHASWARAPMYALLGAFALLGGAVAGMAWTMAARGDPEASAGLVLATTLLAAGGLVLAVVCYRPLLAPARRAPGRASAAPARGRRPRRAGP